MLLDINTPTKKIHETNRKSKATEEKFFSIEEENERGEANTSEHPETSQTQRTETLIDTDQLDVLDESACNE